MLSVLQGLSKNLLYKTVDLKVDLYEGYALLHLGFGPLVVSKIYILRILDSIYIANSYHLDMNRSSKFSPRMRFIPQQLH